MVIVQNGARDIIVVEPTLTKAMDRLGMPRVKYEYLRKKMSGIRGRVVSYKGYFFSRW